MYFGFWHFFFLLRSSCLHVHTCISNFSVMTSCKFINYFAFTYRLSTSFVHWGEKKSCNWIILSVELLLLFFINSQNTDSQILLLQQYALFCKLPGFTFYPHFKWKFESDMQPHGARKHCAAWLRNIFLNY